MAALYHSVEENWRALFFESFTLEDAASELISLPASAERKKTAGLKLQALFTSSDRFLSTSIEELTRR